MVVCSYSRVYLYKESRFLQSHTNKYNSHCNPSIHLCSVMSLLIFWRKRAWRWWMRRLVRNRVVRKDYMMITTLIRCTGSIDLKPVWIHHNMIRVSNISYYLVKIHRLQRGNKLLKKGLETCLEVWKCVYFLEDLKQRFPNFLRRLFHMEKQQHSSQSPFYPQSHSY